MSHTTRLFLHNTTSQRKGKNKEISLFRKKEFCAKKKQVKIFQSFCFYHKDKLTTKTLPHYTQNAAGSPFTFLTPTSRVMKDSFGLEARLLLILQCCHDCKRRKAAGDQGGTKEEIPPQGLRAWWTLQSLLLSHTVSTVSSIPDHGGSLGRDAGMLGRSKLHPTLLQSKQMQQRGNYYNINIHIGHFRVKNIIQLLQATFHCKWK